MMERGQVGQKTEKKDRNTQTSNNPKAVQTPSRMFQSSSTTTSKKAIVLKSEKTQLRQKKFPPDAFQLLISKTPKICKMRDQKTTDQPFQQAHPKEGNSSKFDTVLPH